MATIVPLRDDDFRGETLYWVTCEECNESAEEDGSHSENCGSDYMKVDDRILCPTCQQIQTEGEEDEDS